MLETPWQQLPIIALDLETSGAYPIGDEICEFGGIKFENGQSVSTLEALIKPTYPMTDEIIKIHGITNAMVADSPKIADKIKEIHEFVSQGVVLAHHSPFDVGFLAYDFERFNLELPKYPILCSSLLSIKAFPEIPSHRLQYLIDHFGLKKGQAHRALDDTIACLEVGKLCFEKIGKDATLKEIIKFQGIEMHWKDFSIMNLDKKFDIAINAIGQKQKVEMVYGKSETSKPRVILPKGIVKNPRGDFLYAYCEKDKSNKRFYFNRIQQFKNI